MSEELRSLAARIAGVPADQVQVTLRSPLTHQSNRIYDVRVRDQHWIAKEYLKQDELEDAPRCEFGALTRLQDSDIAPQPVHYQAADGSLGPVVLYEFMDGEMWDRHSPAPAELGQLAAVWLTMNALEGDDLWLSRGMGRSLHEVARRFSGSFRRYADWVESTFPPGRTAASLCREVMEQGLEVVLELDAATPLLCFCRADPRFANVIRRPDGRLGLIDWEDSGLRDPARDLADLITHPNQEDLVSHDQWQAFLQPYLAAHARRDPDMAHRMRLYLALFPLFWLTIILDRELTRIQIGEGDEWLVNDLPASIRLPRYLARALAWPEDDFADRLDDLAGLVFFPAG